MTFYSSELKSANDVEALRLHLPMVALNTRALLGSFSGVLLGTSRS